MTDRTLSPTAQTIYDAFNRIGLYNEPSFETDRKALAAALRAVAEILVEDQMDHYAPDLIRDIAAELEAQ